MGYIWLWKDDPDKYFINKKKRKEKARINKKKREKTILQFSKNREFLKEWTNDEILKNGLNLSAIQSNCSGHTKTSQGYIWEYKKEELVA